MTKLVYNLKFNKGGYIRSYLLHKARKGNLNKCKKDIVHIEGKNSNGRHFIDCDITPEEAVYIAHALLQAYTTWQINMTSLYPKPRKRF